MDKGADPVGQFKGNDATVKEMEAAAIAEVAAHFDIPFLAVKSVTDIVDGGVATAEEFLANLASASKGILAAIHPLGTQHAREKVH